jgi:hypothetical protein
MTLDVTGPKDASKGVLIIFDIFGFFPQTLQGADILSSSDAKQKYQVFMPDWFKGEPCPIEMCVVLSYVWKDLAVPILTCDNIASLRTMMIRRSS